MTTPYFERFTLLNLAKKYGPTIEDKRADIGAVWIRSPVDSELSFFQKAMIENRSKYAKNKGWWNK